MVHFIYKLLNDKGDISNMRFMCLMVCTTACVLALMKGDSVTIGLLLGAAFTGKVVQKNIEAKNGPEVK